MTTNAYLIYWCSEGLESVIPISQYENIDKDNTFRLLNGEEPIRNPVDHFIKMMLMRSRVNQHRHYELYAIDCEEDITSDDLIRMFEEDPQGSADLIRSRGYRLYSDRAQQDRVKIV